MSDLAAWSSPRLRSATPTTRRPDFASSWVTPTSWPPRTPGGFGSWSVGLGVELGGQVVSYHEHNEGRRTAELVELVAAGRTVLLVTDAGMPSVSDPGYRLVSACVEAGSRRDRRAWSLRRHHGARRLGPTGRPVLLRGLPAAQERPATRAVARAGRRVPDHGVLRGAAPNRGRTADMAEMWGPDRSAAVCRELTKTYEEVRRGPPD